MMWSSGKVQICDPTSSIWGIPYSSSSCKLEFIEHLTTPWHHCATEVPISRVQIRHTHQWQRACAKHCF